MAKKVILFVVFFLLAGTGIYMYFDKYVLIEESTYYHVDVDSREVLHEVDDKFLSVALDASFMRCLFHKLNDSDWEKLAELSSLLSPAYLRFGGTDADRLVFDLNNTMKEQFVGNFSCENNPSGDNITITGEDWIKFNRFVKASGLDLIVDLNVLLRKQTEWDSTNARELIEFSQENGFNLDFQLGNEPNSFPHVFNTTITGRQLARDFRSLRKLLNSTKAYKKSRLIGPDVTRPRHLETSSLKFLDEFLGKGDVVDVASWHQYYLNGRNATLEDFMNPDTLDILPNQIQAVSRVVREHSPTIPIWISETSSAYGGGAPKLSNRFAASFLWLDKLGVAGQSNISVVVRQSLFKDYYALITDRLTPTPDFWISLLYKKLVGKQVLKVAVAAEPPINYLRLYGHCLAPNTTLNGSLVLFGMNLRNETQMVVPSGISIVYPVYSFVFRPEYKNLQAKTVLLNDIPLVYNKTTVENMLKMAKEEMYPLYSPPHSIFFWVLKENTRSACQKSVP